MAKVLNQLLYSAVVFGSELPAGSLRLDATSSATKGSIELSAASIDLLINMQIGRLIHSNTALRSYNFPDYSGDVLISGLFTSANQLLYSSAPGVYARLLNTPSSALVTAKDTGQIGWASGTNDQVLTIVDGTPQFTDLPDIGFIHSSPTASQLPYYASAGNELSPLTTIASRVLLSSSTALVGWGLIETTYLKSAAGLPLPIGSATQVLTATGDGSFTWVDKNPAVINIGVQHRLPFYSVSPTGTTLSHSSFIQSEESLRVLQLLNRGGVRFYEATVNGSSYLEVRAPINLGSSVAWILPEVDGSPTATHPSFLSTDGYGNLSFQVFDSGTVNAGLINQVAYYGATGNDVSGLPTIATRTLLSTGSGMLSWSLLSEPYLATTGGVSLAGGLLNQVLVSDGSELFVWKTAVDLTGEVLLGVENYVAFYPSSATKVQSTSFLAIDDNLKIFNLFLGGKIRFFPPTGDDYLEVLAPSSCTTTSWTLPSDDGINGYVLGTSGTGILSFIEVGRGIVHAGQSLSLAYYSENTNEVHHWPNIVNRVALTTSDNEIAWGLLTANYLSKAGGGFLDNGIANYALTSNGSGSFQWTDIVSIAGKVNEGFSTRLAFYAVDGNQVYSSLWLNNAEVIKTLELLQGGKLRFYNVDGIYAELQASPATLSSVSWILPTSDGLAGQFLFTDGLGNLAWATNRINTGTINSIAYYNAENEVSSSSLLIPTGVPSLLGSTLQVEQVSGQLYYAVIVAPLATPGQIAFYTDTQQVGYSANLFWNTINNTIELLDNSGISFYNSIHSTTLRASHNLTAPISLTLPPSLPVDDGYVLSSESDGSLHFIEPSSDVRWEKRGVASLLPGMRSITILYDNPFDTTPSWINLQWAFTAGSVYLPTYAVEKSTPEGFIVRFSTVIPSTGNYKLNWQSFASAVNTPASSIFIIGGKTDIDYLDSIYSMIVDLDISIVLTTSLSSSRAYTSSGSSTTQGFILGGELDNEQAVGIISAFLYQSEAIVDLATSLISSRVGASSLGSRHNTYIAGGQGITAFTDIEVFRHTTEVVELLAATLMTQSIFSGTSTSYTKGSIINGFGNVELLNYLTESLNVSQVSFGSTSINVGCNNTSDGKAYFASNTGVMYEYDYNLDTNTTLPTSLVSTSGLSVAANSLENGYFAGSSLLEVFNFSTSTLTAMSSLPRSNCAAASSSSFQSKGIL